MNNPFLIDLFKRLFSKNPKFFQYLQIVALVIGAASGVIDYLKGQSVALPEWVDFLGNSMIWVGSIIAMVIAQLPVPDKK